jgi:hypothetical protein
MGYSVTLLQMKQTVTDENLKKFDAVCVRAYKQSTLAEWQHDIPMRHMPVARVLYSIILLILSAAFLINSLYPFTVSRTRVTDENAEVKNGTTYVWYLLIPIKITTADFSN